MLRPSFRLTLLCAALTGCAGTATQSDQTAIAAVQAVYMEVAPDIYVSEKLLSAPPSHDYWVKLTMSNGEGADTTRMARVPASLHLAAGDQVAVEMATPLTADMNSTPRRANRVRNLLSHGALAAADTPPRGDVIDRYLSDSAPSAP